MVEMRLERATTAELLEELRRRRKAAGTVAGRKPSCDCGTCSKCKTRARVSLHYELKRAAKS